MTLLELLPGCLHHQVIKVTLGINRVGLEQVAGREDTFDPIDEASPDFDHSLATHGDASIDHI